MRIDLSHVPAPDRESLASALATLTMLEDVVRWGHARNPPRTIADVVVQDEYTHDVVLPYGDGLWLVFETT